MESINHGLKLTEHAAPESGEEKNHTLKVKLIIRTEAASSLGCGHFLPLPQNYHKMIRLQLAVKFLAQCLFH